MRGDPPLSTFASGKAGVLDGVARFSSRSLPNRAPAMPSASSVAHDRVPSAEAPLVRPSNRLAQWQRVSSSPTVPPVEYHVTNGSSTRFRYPVRVQSCILYYIRDVHATDERVRCYRDGFVLESQRTIYGEVAEHVAQVRHRPRWTTRRLYAMSISAGSRASTFSNWSAAYWSTAPAHRRLPIGRCPRVRRVGRQERCIAEEAPARHR